MKFVATRCQILRLKCTKLNFGSPAVELTALPRSPAGFKGPTSKGGEGRRGKKRGRQGGEGRERRRAVMG